ncbi:hypothetical protein C0995_006801 [Termitomyces sp. Mi166|nr:hypothetical protein C0995_006801 [Termitomyces sp. Mi166\
MEGVIPSVLITDVLPFQPMSVHVPPPPDWKTKVTHVDKRIRNIASSLDAIKRETCIYHRCLRDVAYSKCSLFPPQRGYFGLNHALDPELEKAIERELQQEAEAKRKRSWKKSKKFLKEAGINCYDLAVSAWVFDSEFDDLTIFLHSAVLVTERFAVASAVAYSFPHSPVPHSSKVKISSKVQGPSGQDVMSLTAPPSSPSPFPQVLITSSPFTDNVGPPGKRDVMFARHGRGQISAPTLCTYDSDQRP